MLKRIAIIVVLGAPCLFGQGALVSFPVQSPTGQALAGASIALCQTQPSNAIPCGLSSLQQTYVDNSLVTTCTLNPVTLGPLFGPGCTNPGITDGHGMAFIAAATGLYYYQAYGQGIQTTYVSPIFFPSGVGTGASFASSGVFNDTQVNQLVSGNINSLNFLSDYQAMQGNHGMTTPIIGGISIPNGATGIIDAGVSGFANTNSVGGVGHPNALAFYGQARCLVNGSDCFGANFAVKDNAGLTSNVILNGIEVDLDPQNAPGTYIGLVGINGVFQPLSGSTDYANWRMFDVSPNTPTSTIGVGYGTENAAADTAFQAGSSCTTGTCNSQPYLAVALNSSANVGVQWHADQFGNFVVTPHGSGQLVAPLLGLTNTTQQIIFNAGASPTYTINVPTPASNRQVNMPDIGVNAFFGLSLNATSGAYQAIKGIPGCTTGTSIGNTCGTAITVNWTTAFQNTNYSAGCNASGAPTNLPGTPYISAKSTSSITVNYFAITAAAASWATIDCWAIHD